MKRVFLYFFLSLGFLCQLSCVENTPSMENEKIIPTENERPLSPYDEEIQNEGGDSRFFQEFVSMLFSLGIILGAIFILMWILRRMMNARMEQVNLTSSIKIIERRLLSPKTTIYILEIGEKAVTIADSHNGVTLLSTNPLETLSEGAKGLQAKE